MGAPKTPKVAQRVFWRAVKAGLSTDDAAAAAGVSGGAAGHWFRNAGGMAPLDLDEPSGRQLSLVEREEIAIGLELGWGVRMIARGLGRAPSTVSREVQRNSRVGHQPGARRGSYRGSLAQSKAEERALRPKPSKLATCARLREAVQTRLRREHSPEQISRRLVVDFPDDEEMQVSHETIYQGLYVQGRGALSRDLTACLRTGRAVRKPRRRVDGRRERIKDKVMIADRPPDVADRAVPGHWEGDLITGAYNASAIGTLVERTTRYTMLLHLPQDHGAEAVRDAITEAMSTLPAQLRRTLTWDQGIELARHLEVTAAADLPVYFCDPAKPWQRGTNENTNGLLRQYFPKGTNLRRHDKARLDAVTTRLNDRPRKTLAWRTPAEALHALLSENVIQPSVATTP